MSDRCNQIYKRRACDEREFCSGLDDDGTAQIFCKECWSDETDRECGTMEIEGKCQVEGCINTIATKTIYLASDGIWRYICYVCILERVGLKSKTKRRKEKMHLKERKIEQDLDRNAVEARCQECLNRFEMEADTEDHAPICPSCREDPMSFIAVSKYGRYFDLTK
jgi:hypothetical protein